MKRVQTMPDIQIRRLSASVPDRSGSSFPSESLRGGPERIGSSNGASVSSVSLSAKFQRKALPPHQAMLLLKAGNERFIRGRPMAASMNHQARHQLEMFQAPHTAVVGCADCPVPLETIFDAMPGDIFALRNAGNTCAHAEGSMMGSVEFCCSTLGSRLIVVLGHTECRAVEGAARTYLDASNPRHSEGIVLELMKSVEKADAELGEGGGASPSSPCSPSSPSRRAKLVQAAVKVNVYRTINYLLQCSSPIQSKVKNGQLEVLGALFNNKTGRVEFIGKSPHEEMILSSSLPSSIALLLRQAQAPRDRRDRLPEVPQKASPGWALQKLTEGNARFALGTTLDFRSAKPEATYAAVVSCSDCPVSAEAIFDSMPGSLFVLPNAGNTCSQAESILLGSLEFCTSKLNVPLILILGHRDCDAICSCTRMIMDAGKNRQDSFGQEMIMQDLQAVIHHARAEMGPNADIHTVADHAIKVNIFQTMEHLLRHSERLRELVRNSELELQGGIFDKASGCVEFLGHVPRLEDLLRLDDDHGAAEQRSARSAAAAVSLTSAEAALKLLQEGNSRWVSGTAVASRIPKAMAETAPFCAVIGCADLRTPVEQIFDSMPGEIFVLRNAGNTITHAKGSMVTSLEFCTCKLMTKLILILGHTACMALSSAMCVETCAGKASDALVQGIRSASDGSKEISMEEAVELNIYHTMDCLLQYSSCIREKVQTGELEIRGAVYKCATGQVQFLPEAHAGPKETLKGA